MSEQRRHRLIWAAVGCVHLAALAGVIASGSLRSNPPATVAGGMILVRLDAEPMGQSGEVTSGLALGGGALNFIRDASAVLRSAVPEVTATAATPVVNAAPQGLPVAAPATPSVVRSEPVFLPPQFLERVEPVYPERARRSGVEGRVVIQVQISATGQVLSATIGESSGSPSLDAAALAAAQGSRFTPAHTADRPVPSAAVATYRFELR